MTLSLAAIISEISFAQNVHFKVTAGPFKGGSNTVYQIQSDDGKQWCLRIPLNDFAAGVAARGVAILKILKEMRPTLAAPAVIYMSDRYMVMEYFNGEALGSWNTRSLTREQRRVLLDDVATFLFSLWTLDVQLPDGLGCKITYRDYLRKEVDRGLLRTLKGTATWGDPIHYLYRRMEIDGLVPSRDDGATAIKHGDLNAWNVIDCFSPLVLINDSVVDWDNSRLAPLPSAIQHPLFIADIPGWRNDGVSEGMTFEEDREYLENAVGKLDASSQNPGRIAHLLRTSFERQFLEMSLHNRRINDEYIQQRFDNTKFDRDAALQQLEDFLSNNESMQDFPGVLDVRRRLTRES
ncbi:hypothetical protein PRK78_004781 [Emydomyces testavorans]|uniref:Aminoglycoside phosphotransferase domain-containing protein n=1 Tax=Emydomyces testavorans TaxID=2070801 RepID=A0AAF0DIN1_9EURO|nr:hypothetical protein PRK78_004781 [Emydomyces testavorans]